MTHEEIREEHPVWFPTPQLPKLAPPVDRTGTHGAALGDTQGVEANFDLKSLLGAAAQGLGSLF
ncbi:hypothetical protein [Streptomyces rubellomurinus]|uniref:Uncharacterized protein n=2 Tax=Streptomyces TaxID=1883 RepID=A0A0F2TAT6_STRR3|nr:hypothetical protein [Streptomyces rubellomurinus]KJS52632.1 hypothetical protein VM98_30170 [Streptomyces rubellomurinus subsp. indigoferus]KJS58837.1 hypothetical protein VM95_30815 [Streptomyces rubellomurinus]